MTEIDFLSVIHKSTERDYVARVTEYPKARASRLAKKWDIDYWDGDRQTGYGGYKYDGRWRKVADMMVEQYGLKAGDRVLDVGCGKGFLLYDLTQAVPGLEVTGIDISAYAIANAKTEIKDRLQVANASHLPFADNHFDFVFSINTLHNLANDRLELALAEMERVGKDKADGGKKYICVESYRSEEEKVNLMYWQLTCEQFCSPDEWQWWFNKCGYTGDYSFIYFE